MRYKLNIFLIFLFIFLLLFSFNILIKIKTIENENNNNDFIDTTKIKLFNKYANNIMENIHNNLITEKWRFLTEGCVEGGFVLDEGNTIYFGDKHAYFYAIYPNSDLKWKISLDGLISSTPVLNDNSIYIGTTGDILYAINSDDGDIIWSFNTEGSIYSSPLIDTLRTIYIGNMNGNLIAVNPNGTEKWIFETGDSIISNPVFGNDGTICFGSLDNYFYSIYPNGTLNWRFKTGDIVKSHPSIGVDGTIYFSSFDGYLYALNPDGTLKWKFDNPGSGVNAVAIADGGTLYLGGQMLYAINPDGTLKWSFDLGENRRIGFSSPIINNSGTIFVGLAVGDSNGGELIAINPNGIEQWRSDIICNLWIQSSPCIGSDETVYIGSSSEKEFEPGKWTNNGYLHAFGRIESNTKPELPYIDGPSSGKINEIKTYYFLSNDPDNNPVFIYVDWGDSTTSNWFGLFASGELIFLQHIWSEQGNYTIRVKAKDIMGAESDWATLGVTMPRNKPYINLYQWLLDMLDRWEGLIER